MNFLLVLKKNRIPLICLLIATVALIYKKAGATNPVAYHEQEVTYENAKEAVTLSGTLTTPLGKGPFPAALLIHGYGAQTRDDEILGHKVFYVLADHLTRQGLAVLRFDKRGVGKSTGCYEIATSEDFASDVLAGIEFLKTQPQINHSHIGLIGHSEGGLIAPMAASKSNDVAFIVMLAAPAVNGEELLYEQGELILRSTGASAEEIAKDRLLREHLFAIVKQESDKEKAQIQIQEILAKEVTPEKMNELRSEIALLNTSWCRFFLTYDPAKTLSEINIPLLALNGTCDVQVSARQNLPVIAKALENNTACTIVELPSINHLFQTCTTGALSEYGQIEETIAPTVLNTISSWILEQTVPR